MDERLFYSLLERVGGNGKYQTVMLSVWSILMAIVGSTGFFLPYLFYQSKYQCPQGYTNCKEYVCTLQPNERTQFIFDDLYSLPSKFGDYRCDNNVELDWLQSFIYVGGVAGVFVGAFVNEIVTKRMLLILTTVANIVGLGMALVGQTILISSIGLFINFAAAAIQHDIIQCYIVETVSEDVRGQQITITNIFFGLGVTLNGLFFYLLKNWQTYLIILLPVLATILLFLIFYIQETPFDLIINFSPEDSLLALNKIGAANDKEHDITLAELTNIKKEYSENQQKKQHDNISILDLFRYDSLRVLTIVSFVIQYVISFQFAAPQISIRNYSLSIYTNGAVIGFAELAGSVLCYFIIDHYERKKVVYITEAICIATSVPVFLFFSCSSGTCSIQTQIIQTIGLCIFRFASTVAYNFFYMMQFEAFPNQIRGLAIQVVCIPAYFAAVTIPQIITLCESSGISIVFTFVLCSIIIVSMITFLPQTYGIPPPEMIEELKYEHCQIKDPIVQEKIKET